jgi:hypothetical protein
MILPILNIGQLLEKARALAASRRGHAELIVRNFIQQYFLDRVLGPNS